MADMTHTRMPQPTTKSGIRTFFDPKEIARNLTGDEQRAVARGRISRDTESTRDSLVNRYFLFYLNPTIGTDRFSYELTNFGRAVQAELGRVVR